MTDQCSNGHDSEWPDWCSVCGERIGDAEEPAAPAAPPAAVGPTCDNCGVPRHEHDVFCESCGLDFASGSLPETSQPDSAATPATSTPVSASASPPSETSPGAATPAAEATMLHTRITVDEAFFTNSVGDAELELPSPIPEQQIVPLTAIRNLIGRKSVSRGVFPELDVRALTDDPAVSTQHAMLERDTNGNWTLTDLGSTNGTYLDAEGGEPIVPGEAIAIEAGSVFYIGAWSRIEVAQTTQ